MKKCCYCCGKEIGKDEIGINKKMIDVEINEFQCLSCLAEDFDTTVEELQTVIKIFKEQDCELFR